MEEEEPGVRFFSEKVALYDGMVVYSSLCCVCVFVIEFLHLCCPELL